MSDRANNFDALRLVAASSVIFSHAFLIGQGEQESEPLRAATHSVVLGVAGVFVFFIISGYLVTQSFERTGTLGRFALKRALRIYPGLAACLLVCAYGLGPLLTALPLTAYLTHSSLYRFLAHNLVMEVSSSSLPGVVFNRWGFGWVVNAPLWTLPLEVGMYVMVAVLGSLRLMRWPVLLALLIAGVASDWIDTGTWHNYAGGFLWLLGFFAVGMLVYRLHGRWLFDRRLVLLAFIGLVASVPLHLFVPLFPLFGGFLTLHMALDPRLPVIPAARFGDLSYGLYIYGWPIEMVISRLHGGGAMPWWELFAIAYPASIAAALLSWHLIEKPALRLKQFRFSSRVRAA